MFTPSTLYILVNTSDHVLLYKNFQQFYQEVIKTERKRKLLKRPTHGSLQWRGECQWPTLYYVNGLNRHTLNSNDYIKARKCKAQGVGLGTNLRCSSPCSPEGTVRHSSMCPCSNLRTSPPMRYPVRIGIQSHLNGHGQMLIAGQIIWSNLLFS